MIQRQEEVVRIPLDQRAEERIREYVDDFTTTLILGAKLAAHKQTDYVVVERHVNEGYEAINRERSTSWLNQILVVVGGAFVGAFVPGFVTEVTAGPTNMHVPFLVGYTIMGFVGIILAFAGLRR